MTVWLVTLGMAAVLTLLLLRGRFAERRSLVAVAMALTTALGGYAATGRPDLPAAVEDGQTFDRDWHSAFETARQTRLVRFGEAGAWLTFSDAMLREDASDTAVRGLQGVLADHPDQFDLWIGLGNALAMHQGAAGEASRLAFARAQSLEHASPQPDFFLGLAELETGDARSAARTWRTLAARGLPDATLERWIAEADIRAAGQPD
ncbi:tetratricopeptide repeat protein [Glacieibacterium sp.]|uniref:tetratricopeptide repeat protein n=1 Tax=Glacieibacterium sp. TaxID=2860237 RepID=UPI003AFF8BDB